MKHEYNLNFDKLFEIIGLGELTGKPEQLFGGHLHRMYAVQTARGKYAVKALNPLVMARPEAKRNITNAERIAQLASKHVPAAPAKIFGCGFMPELDGQYYLVFDWIEGKTIFTIEQKKAHCTQIGGILADIHQIDFSSLKLTDNYYSEEKLIDWNNYLCIGRSAHAPWVDLYCREIDNLYNWSNRTLQAAKLLDSDTVISHCDLDPKNVMWRDGTPILIDWEAAGFIHPMHDLIETALYWSAYQSGTPEKDKFMAFISGYSGKGGTPRADWNTILDKGFSGKLGWLEYSLKRSLGIEAADEAERLMGTEHVTGTLSMLLEYDGAKSKIITWLEE
jgi:aminoglycoside phosphotransferase (APT) family kinase protein